MAKLKFAGVFLLGVAVGVLLASRLLEIEEELAGVSVFAGRGALRS